MGFLRMTWPISRVFIFASFSLAPAGYTLEVEVESPVDQGGR